MVGARRRHRHAAIGRHLYFAKVCSNIDICTVRVQDYSAVQVVGGHVGDIAAMAMLKGEKWPAVKQEERKESSKLIDLSFV